MLSLTKNSIDGYLSPVFYMLKWPHDFIQVRINGTNKWHYKDYVHTSKRAMLRSTGRQALGLMDPENHELP